MSIELRDYTMLIYKKDRRYKCGETLHNSYDYKARHEQWMKEEVRDLQSGLYPEHQFRIALHETYVERVNLMTGKKYLERFDAPLACSPSMESYWSA
jgi:hypothetical protein